MEEKHGIIIALPLVPIIIGVCVVAMSLLGKITPLVGTAAKILWVVSLIIFGYVIIIGILRETTWFNRIFGTCLSLVSGFIGILVSKNFFDSLAASSNSSISGILDMFILIILGGPLWLSTVGCCFGGCSCVLNDEDPLRFFKSAGLILAAWALASVFNLM